MDRETAFLEDFADGRLAGEDDTVSFVRECGSFHFLVERLGDDFERGREGIVHQLDCEIRPVLEST